MTPAHVVTLSPTAAGVEVSCSACAGPRRVVPTVEQARQLAHLHAAFGTWIELDVGPRDGAA